MPMLPHEAAGAGSTAHANGHGGGSSSSTRTTQILPGSNITVRFMDAHAHSRFPPANLKVRLFAEGAPNRQFFQRINSAVASGSFGPEVRCKRGKGYGRRASEG